MGQSGQLMRFLVIEDEPEIAAFVARLLEQLNGVTDIVGTLSDAQHTLESFNYDLAVVDRMLPDGDALKICLAHIECSLGLLR